jgi:tetratricopeptide (TPR) repeat protein
MQRHGSAAAAAVASQAHRLLAAGAGDMAERLCRDALAAGEQHPRLLSVLGLAEAARGELSGAAMHLAEAMCLAPNDAGLHYNLGVVLQRGGRTEEAAMAWRQATRIKPDYADAWFNLAKAFGDLDLNEEARIAYGRLLDLEPGHAPALYNLGSLLHRAGHYAGAVAALRRATAAAPKFAEAWTNLALSLAKAGRTAEAIATSEHALALAPGLVDAHWNFSQILLSAGHLRRGFEEYEWRWRRPETPPRELPAPPWDGAPLDGRTILLHAEQGLGDTIQFARYAPLVAARGGRVVLEAHAELVWLLRGIEAVEQVVARGGPLPPVDCHAPLMSLPRLFATTLETIPAEVPYLKPADAPVARWAARLADRPGPRIGLCWQGSPVNRYDRERSIPLPLLDRLSGIAGLSFVSLQKGPGEDQLDHRPETAAIVRLDPDLDGGPDAFRDTVAVLHLLDLVVTVDTAPAHLAGALARPVWLMLPEPADWRWLRERADSPWYPTMRLFRQPNPGDWDGVVEAVGRALRERFAGRQ